ncbi:hypothetical protein Q7P37_000363 [Cladosporium fusiforme]
MFARNEAGTLEWFDAQLPLLSRHNLTSLPHNPNLVGLNLHTCLHFPAFLVRCRRLCHCQHQRLLSALGTIRSIAMSAYESAIDDSFNPTPLPQDDGDDDNDDVFDNAYNGPREGHWEVSSSVGSFIDDRCPTVYGYPARPAAGGHAAAIDAGLAKKLMKATIEERRVARNAAHADGAVVQTQPSLSPPVEEKPHPFIVPPLRPGATRALATHPNKSAKPNLHTTLQHDKRKAVRQNAPPKPAAQAPDARKATNTYASQPWSNGRKIRILGRNGEEAFVELPSFPNFSTPPSSRGRTTAQHPMNIATEPAQHEPSPHSAHVQPTPETSKQTKQSKSNAKRPKIQPKEKSPTQMHTQQASVPEPAEATMSGALPASAHRSQSARNPAAGSCKDSGIVMANALDGASRHGSNVSQRALSVAQSIAKISAASSKKPSTVRNNPLPQSFEQTGVGRTTGFPAQSWAVDESNRPAVVQQWASQKDSPTSSRRREWEGVERIEGKANHEWSEQINKPSNYKPPTVQSANSSSSIAHSFGGFRNDNTPHPQDQVSQTQRSQASTRQPQSGGIKSNRSDASASSNHGINSDIASSRQRRSAAPSAASRSRVHSQNNERPNSKYHTGWTPVPSHAASPRPWGSDRQQTNFAGDGWISPHPLSVATSDVGASPQSAVRLSTPGLGQHGTLTYEEWKAQRDRAGSISGSFAGSHVPTAVGPQAVVPWAAYNHPPPAGYVGSYREVTRRSQRLEASAHGAVWSVHQQDDDLWGAQQDDSYRGSRQDAPPGSLGWEETQGYAETIHTPSAHSGSAHQFPSAFAQNADWSFPPQYDGSGSDRQPPYNVGLTPTELDAYQRQLGSTVSRYSSQLAQVQQEQAPPQPDYSVWNSGQSQRASSCHSGGANSPSHHSFSRAKTQLTMPWDQVPSQSSEFSAQSDNLGILDVRGPWGREHSGINELAGTTPSTRESIVSASTSSINGSAISQSTIRAPQSEVSYGIVEWQQLESAEQGQGSYQLYAQW